ncbi:WS/DGAT/MGAT family acyltransferase [Agromyces flavus]|uniref:diacylglycerol O-acyltransferase n=1 Tax=Agromyces flavus TaxID=589382 RepID=A0A1H1ZN69_9MICO|nr:wax ester/triacylglycerol synthase domain-containing protein [Agromyces flavus]MCP2367173.1 WS/DGAT/MGAT family acyltransferase [Agromyces flavus]GGI46257.1 diacylglycerol O-acyltransferase [Agromyces flavus]SDT35093.1 acyltransferase, WS/DGAT/MGAT [Agromyces flavus]
MAGPVTGRERLSAADASNLVMDAHDQVNVFLMAGVLGPGGPIGGDGSPDVAALRTAFAAVVPSAPRLSQQIVPDGRKFAWEPVSLDLSEHVRLVDPVDGLSGLEALCAQLMVTPLPLDRPLWELLLVPGVAPRRTGLVFRIHHAMADGVAAVRLIELLLDPGAMENGSDVAALGSPAVAKPRSIDEAVVQPAARVSPSLRTRWRTLASGVERTTAVFRHAVPRTALLGPIGPRRGIAFVDMPLDALGAGAVTAGATINDALLTAVVAAAEGALRARGEPVPQVLPATVPVALADRGRSGNAVGVMLVPLPTGIADVATRLRRVAELTRPRKADARARGTFELTRTRVGTMLFSRFVRYQRLIVMFVSNVRGPRHPLALAGAPLEHVWPIGPVQGNVRLGVAALSYDGLLRCGVHVDADALDAEVFGDALRRELERVAALAGAANDVPG